MSKLHFTTQPNVLHISIVCSYLCVYSTYSRSTIQHVIVLVYLFIQIVSGFFLLNNEGRHLYCNHRCMYVHVCTMGGRGTTLYVLISSSRTSSLDDAHSRDLYFSSRRFRALTSSCVLGRAGQGRGNSQVQRRAPLYEANGHDLIPWPFVLLNPFPPNDTIWCHHGHGLSISLWEFIWGV